MNPDGRCVASISGDMRFEAISAYFVRGSLCKMSRARSKR